ncbi:MAG: indole-3-glycerol phosphate synthase TrpC [Butyrivibrio sp.]|nr:indole-3-glycerol phosphate synthase TrpC [Acetatifactor muris]MCM1558481.1 indole-3-glycerol phosphate synthase TrpC [Butyrivibrio sp.]
MILDEIAAKTRERIEAEKRKVSVREMEKLAREAAARRREKEGELLSPNGRETVRQKAEDGGFLFPFERALAGPGMSFICEVKKASPSKGVIAEQFPYVEIGKGYEAAGADAMSVLTEPFYFKGSDEYLSAIRREVSIPLLRKDFTVDEYMIYQAGCLGADAVLLICAILSPGQLSEYGAIARELGLSALVEAHDEQEVEMALTAGARIIGVNNRNLKDFTVDIENSLRLRKLVPRNILFVSESGMKTRADIARLEENGTDGVLIGETFMRSPDKAGLLKELRGSEYEN